MFLVISKPRKREVMPMTDLLALIPRPGTHITSALSAAGLTNLFSLEVRVGYFGTGQRLHVFIGCPDIGDGSGIWMKACAGSSWSGYGKPFTFGNQDMEKEHQPGAKANCWHCAKALGIIDRYPGTEERRRIEREGGPFASYQGDIDSLSSR